MIAQEGTATFSGGETSVEVGPGNVVIFGAGEPHAFTNTGDGPLRQIDPSSLRSQDVSDAFQTDWL